MSSRLDLRVARLERVSDANGVDLRVYGSSAESEADTRPAEGGWWFMPSSRALFARRGAVRALELRVARLEGAVAGLAPCYVVRLPPDAVGDGEARRGAIAEHRRCTGWTGWVVLAPARMTHGEWVARYGRSD